MSVWFLKGLLPCRTKFKVNACRSQVRQLVGHLIGHASRVRIEHIVQHCVVRHCVVRHCVAGHPTCVCVHTLTSLKIQIQNEEIIGYKT